ncbi:UNVERIFIED_CONTAM: hypothetical protein NCL1_18678 [Trichonephila clavipes]
MFSSFFFQTVFYVMSELQKIFPDVDVPIESVFKNEFWKNDLQDMACSLSKEYKWCFGEILLLHSVALPFKDFGTFRCGNAQLYIVHLFSPLCFSNTSSADAITKSLPNSQRLGSDCGRGSRVVKVSDCGLPCHEFEPSTTKDPPCRAAMHVKSAES